MATALDSANYHVWWVSSDCVTVIAGLTDAGVLETLGGIEIDVDFSTGRAITVDIDVPLAGDDYVYGLDIDLQQTSAYAGTWSTSGGLIALRSDVHVDMQITDAYAGYFNVYVDPAATCTVNDAVGVLANVTLVGPFTQGAATSSIAALKGNISNSSTGSYDGQVFNVMLSYGSSVNYDGDTALVMGYTHADARCDYGFYLKNYSPYMVAGIYITDVLGAVPVIATAIHVDASCTTGINIGTTTTGLAFTGISGAGGDDMDTGQIVVADDAAGTALAYGTVDGSYVIERVNVTAGLTGASLRYLIGKYDTYTTSSVFTNGMIMGSYQKITLDHTTLESNAVRGRICIDAAQVGGTSNQHIAVIGQCELAAVAIASASTGLYCGVRGMASSESGCTANAPMNGGYFSTNAVSDITGEVSAIKARMIGFTDYGLKMHVYTSNATAGICIQTDESAVLPIGLEFTSGDGSGSITAAFAFRAAGTAPVVASATGAGDAAEGSIVILIDGTPKYLQYFAATA